VCPREKSRHLKECNNNSQQYAVLHKIFCNKQKFIFFAIETLQVEYLWFLENCKNPSLSISHTRFIIHITDKLLWLHHKNISIRTIVECCYPLKTMRIHFIFYFYPFFSFFLFFILSKHKHP
jgi:hypothetical protein